MPSFQGIQKDCEDISEQLKSKLRLQFHNKTLSTEALARNFNLLLQLKEPADSLCSEFLMYAEERLTEQLEILKDTCENDIIEFVDMASSGFLNDLCLIVAFYNDMFINRLLEDDNLINDFDVKATSCLNDFILNNMRKYFELLKKRVEDVADTAVLVRALDRFYRRLQDMNTLCRETNFVR